MGSNVLFPVFSMPQTVAQARAGQPAVQFKRSYRFDFALGDFVFDGTGRVERVDGHTAWRQWCVKTALTQRNAYVAYSRRYGCDLEGARRLRSRAAVEAALRRELTAALLANPQTKSVDILDFAWEGDTVTVTLAPTPAYGPTEPLEVTLDG